MSESSKKTIVVGVTADLVVAVAKLVAGVASGSAAVLAEGVHSLVDASHDVLLYVGLRRANRPPDDDHPFGYGKEVYFWSLIMAMMLAFAGGAVTIVQGIVRAMHPKLEGSPVANFVVLGVAIVADGASVLFSKRKFDRYRRKEFPGATTVQAMKASKDPTEFAVLLEDSVAVVGNFIALAGVGLAHALKVPIFDPIASISIGVLLVVAATLFAIECHALLIGERATPHVVQDIARMVRELPHVTAVHEVCTMQLGPKAVIVMVRVELEAGLTGADVSRVAARIDRDVREAHSTVRRVLLDTRGLASNALAAE